MIRQLVFVSLLVSTQVLAAGSGRYESSSDKSPLAKVEKLVAQEDYSAASTWLQSYLQSSKGRRSADAWNLLGFSQRKLGQYSQALYAYQQALSIKPSHLGALEYSGELYLSMQQPQRAQQNLQRLEQYCGDCEEKLQLTSAINRYIAEN
ncbi:MULTISPECIES: tetratricopeptide repeat protein [unclassified Agarivorans]|uniref:tetratricopeptide repeat protein n=1 Tax=unclassified Agarivorans TaxID=2636026 RepID=UPI0026E27D7C|nr:MULTISPECIES: tetratricopeptide repeat protein [unclassified Agarivorans]MDO6686165.1 tetratricopeptide repeat protein [Agarivorans sp. 3_MG-2023]MDO6716386.1 tetratricopeptide repeat protein [Agarivorans sp. 2_MG-2023]